MDPVFQSYGENIRCLPGKSIYIALTKRINNKLFLIKTDHPDCPKYELDWLCLNWMNNAADIIVQSVIPN